MGTGLYRGDLVTVIFPGADRRSMGWIQEVVTVRGRAVGAWIYPVRDGRLDRELGRHYLAEDQITWLGLSTERTPGRLQRAIYALARVLALAQLPDSPDWGAEAALEAQEDQPGDDP